MTRTKSIRRLCLAALIATTLSNGLLFSQPAINALSANPPGLSQNVAQVGSSQFVLTVRGSGFSNASIVRLGTVNLVTTFNDSTNLTAVIPAALLKTVGPQAVTVLNDPVVSNAIDLTVAYRGDVNKSGSVSIGDALTLANYSGGVPMLPIPLPLGDVNLNDSISIGDALVTALFNGGVTANLPTPTIVSMNPTSSLSTGSQLGLTGTGFSSNAADNIIIFSRAGGGFISIAAMSVTPSPGPKTITAIVPDNAASGPVFVKRKDLGLPGQPFVVTITNSAVPLYVSKVNPATGVAAGASTLTITGSGFNAIAGNNSVTFSSADGSTITTAATSASPASLTVPVPAQAVTGAVWVSTGGRTSNRKALMVSGTPAVLAIQHVYYPETEGEPVLIEGTGFDPVNPSNNQVLFSGGTGEVSGSVVGSGRTELVVLVPSGSLTGTVRVVTNNGANSSNTFDYIGSAGGPNTSPVANIVFVDASGSPTRELVVNQGNTAQVSIRVFDAGGNSRTGVPVSFRVLDAAVATVDTAARITGREAGFTTLTAATSDGVVSTATITVVQVASSTFLQDANSVAQDLSRRLYLASSQNQTILLAEDLNQTPVTYAGVNQTPGFRNDLRLQSLFRNPAFLAFSQADGSLYVSDSANNVIRRIVPGPAGTVETFAGSGSSGFQDGAALDARFNNPQGIALDGVGNLWIVDSGNHVIRRINLSTRVVSTIAGLAGSSGSTDGTGDQARFNAPIGIALLAEDVTQQLDRFFRNGAPPVVKMVVADTGNGVIRRVSETGVVETIAPAATTTSAPIPSAPAVIRGVLASPATPLSFSLPAGIAADASGNVYITEPSTGNVKTILRNGSVVPAVQPNTFTAPKGIVVTQSGKVLIADSGHAAQELSYGRPEIISISPGTILNTANNTVTIAGKNFAPETAVLVAGVVISNPQVLSSESISIIVPPLPSGRTTVTVVHRGGLAQQQLIISPRPLADLPAGYITTVAGGGTYIGDGGAGSSGALSAPKGIALDSTGNLFVADYGNSRIRRVDAQTGIITTVAGNGVYNPVQNGVLAVASPIDQTISVAVDNAGTVFFSSGFGIHRVDSHTGILTTISTHGLLYGQLVADANGNLYICDQVAYKVFRIAAGTSTLTTVAGGGSPSDGLGDGQSAVTAALNSPLRIAVDAAGNIFISEEIGNRIRMVSAATGIITTVTSGLRLLSGLTVDTQGNLFAIGALPSDYLLGIFKIDVSTGSATRIFLFNSTGPSPSHLSSDAGGNLYFSDPSTNQVKRVNISTGIVTIRAGSGVARLSGDNGPAVGGILYLPRDLAVDTSGSLLVADDIDFRVRKIDSHGTITTVAGNGIQNPGEPANGQPATLVSLPGASLVDSDSSGNIWIADVKVRRVDGATGILTNLPTVGFPSINGLAVSPGGDIFVSRNYTVEKLDHVTGDATRVAGNGTMATTGDGGLATDASLYSPRDLAFDHSGNLYIASPDRIRRVDNASGIITTVAGGGSPSDPLGRSNLPATQANISVNRMDVDANGNIYFTEGQRIRRVDASTGTLTTVATSVSFEFSGDNGPANNAGFWPQAIAVDASGNIYFADPHSSRIRAIKGPLP